MLQTSRSVKARSPVDDSDNDIASNARCNLGRIAGTDRDDLFDIVASNGRDLRGLSLLAQKGADAISP